MSYCYKLNYYMYLFYFNYKRKFVELKYEFLKAHMLVMLSYVTEEIRQLVEITPTTTLPHALIRRSDIHVHQ